MQGSQLPGRFFDREEERATVRLYQETAPVYFKVITRLHRKEKLWSSMLKIIFKRVVQRGRIVDSQCTHAHLGTNAIAHGYLCRTSLSVLRTATVVLVRAQ